MNYSHPDHPGEISSAWDVPHVQAKEFVLERVSNGLLQAKSPAGQWVNVPEALRILDHFQTPQRPREVAQRLSGRSISALAWVSTMETLRGLMEAGVLVPEGRSSIVERPVGFAMASQHISMLNDEPRTAAFLQAIRAVVTPQDVVVDIGTGTGVLALAAALAGAQKVYAIERSAMADVAAAGVKANQLGDRIEVLHGMSTELTLPQPATIIVGEMIGDDLFDENLLPIFADAAKRFATPNATFIPGTIQPVLQPLQLPGDRLGHWFYLPEVCHRWSENYGIDFHWLIKEYSHLGLVRHELKPQNMAKFLCGDNVFLPQVSFPSQVYSYSEEIHWPGSPGCNAFLVGFASDLGFGHQVSNLAGTATASNHWGTILYLSHPGHGPDLTQPQRLRVEWTGGKTQVRVLGVE